MTKEVITFKGEKKIWNKFTKAVKSDGLILWYVMKGLILKYLRRKRNEIEDRTFLQDSYKY